MKEDRRFTFEFVGFPADLAPCINTLFIFRTDEDVLEDILPAYSAQFFIMPMGQAEMRFADGRVAHSCAAFFTTPLQQAAPFKMHGPGLAIGVSLNALGWAALSGIPVDQCANQVLRADQVLSAELAQQVMELSQSVSEGEIDPAGACAQMAQIVRSGIRPLENGHETVIARVVGWLNSDFNPPVEDLYEMLALSPRQVQRLTRRYFGQPPSRLLKRFRAIRAATLLSLPDLPDEMRRQVADAYYDQAHLINDIRHYTGRTPKLLKHESRSVATDTLAPAGYGLVQPFGGGSPDRQDIFADQTPPSAC